MLSFGGLNNVLSLKTFLHNAMHAGYHYRSQTVILSGNGGVSGKMLCAAKVTSTWVRFPGQTLTDRQSMGMNCTGGVTHH